MYSDPVGSHLESFVESPAINRSLSLKAHKTLPRKRVVSAELEERKEHDSPHKRSASESHREGVKSWIENSSPTLSNPNQHLPPTPPALPEDTTIKETPDGAYSEVLADERLVENAATTPVVQLSPLTPDLTPPRPRKKDMHLSSPPTLRFPSSTSAADSFKTAREFVDSADSLRRFSSQESDLNTVVQHHVRSEYIASNKSPQHNDTPGVGLGLDIDIHQGSVATVDSELEVHTEDIVADPLVVQETKAVQQVSRETNQPQPSILEDDLPADTMMQRPDSFSNTREGSLLLKHRIVSDRLESHRRSLKISSDEESGEAIPLRKRTTKYDSTEVNNVDPSMTIQVDAETTVQVEAQDSPAKPSVIVVEKDSPLKVAKNRQRKTTTTDLIEDDIRRLSRISGTSSGVIEALVISPPRNKRHKLRRSSRNHCLRAASVSTIVSNPSSINSATPGRTIRRKSMTLPDKPNRQSLNSDSGISMGYDVSTIKNNIIPTSEVPQRRSSLKKHQRKSSITTPDERRSRPTTAPERLMSPTGEIMSHMQPIFDIRPHSYRRSSENKDREVRHAPPVFIPPRSSSLSAPTTRDNSRAASMNSTVKNQKDRQSQSQRPSARRRSSSPHVRISLPEPELRSPPTKTEGFLDPFRSDDDESGVSPSPSPSPYLRSSLTRTPFSTISTPGPVEYGQGMTMSIYPHHNESVLVVQHTHRPESQEGPVTPVKNTLGLLSTSEPSKVRQRLVYPEARSQEMRRNISATSTAFSSPSKSRNTGKRFNIARTPSGRRHSDSYPIPLSRLVSAAKENTTPRRRIRLDDPSNSLSPFWRPGGFWNDLSDSEADESSEAEDPFDGKLVVRNTLGLPQTPVMLGPVGLASRLGSLRRRKQAQEAKASGQRSSSMSILEKVGSNNTLPRKHGRSISLGPFTHLYESISHKKALREEAQQEERRARLKQSIGPAIVKESARNF